MKILQNANELQWFVDLLKRANVQSYLEIGSKYGGSFRFIVTSALAKGNRAVSVDLPNGGPMDGGLIKLKGCIDDLRKCGYETHLIVGDSTSAEVIDKVNSLAPFDAVFIDANHTLPYVTKDFENYSKMATKLIAFHDIAAHIHAKGRLPIEVALLWNELKNQYKYDEIKLDGHMNGIGVLWR
jgi:cephalosporin hydroxylase